MVDDISWYYLDSKWYTPAQEFGPFGNATMREWYKQGVFAVGEDLMVRTPNWTAHRPLKEIFRDVANDAFVKAPDVLNDVFVKAPKVAIWGPCRGRLDHIPEQTEWTPMDRHQRKLARDEYRMYAIKDGINEEDSCSDDTPLSATTPTSDDEGGQGGDAADCSKCVDYQKYT